MKKPALVAGFFLLSDLAGRLHAWLITGFILA
jgi:hypothetical protein